MSSLKGMLSRWNLKGLSINAGFLQAEISFVDADRNAAWDMYVELLTRVTTQSLKPEDGDEKSALTSVFSLFKLTREIIKKNGLVKRELNLKSSFFYTRVRSSISTYQRK